MKESKLKRKNELEEKCEYLALKERRHKYINYILSIFIIILLVVFIIYINNSKVKANDEIAYVNESNSLKSNSDDFIRFIYDGFNHNNPPSKEKYSINSVSCNNALGKWDNNKWQLNISNIVGKVNCSLTFKKKENNIIITTKKKTTKNETKKDDDIEKESNNKEIIMNTINEVKAVKEAKNIKVVNKEQVLEEEPFKEEIIFDLDKCNDNEDCDYKVSMDSNKEIKLSPTPKLINQDEGKVEYELLSGNDAVELYNNIVCSKNVAYKDAYIKASVKDRNEINTIIKVSVKARLINTRVYDINRHNKTINKIDLNTNIKTFINNIMNKKDYIYVYNKGVRLTNDIDIITTGMKVRLIMNNNIYDELDIVVLGDLDKDGKCTTTDYNLLMMYLNNQIELDSISKIAADINRDNKFDSYDYELIYRYITNYINSFLS